jgi:mycothiol synthase
MTLLRAASPDDAAAVAEVIQAADAADGSTAQTGIDDVLGYWREFDPAESALVAEADGAVVGYVDVLPSARDVHIDAYVHPGWRESGLPLELFRAAEALALERRTGDEPLRATVGSGNPSAAAVLEREGYARVRAFFRMGVDLAEAPPAPQWPAGVEPRPYRAGPDDAVMHATIGEAFEDAWEPRRRSLEEFVRVHATGPDLATEASLIAHAGDDPAGAILSKRKHGGGWIESIGVRRPWRRRGLGLALLRAALAAFYDGGERFVGLGVDAASKTGATRLYERAGMRVLDQYDTYEKRAS